MNKAVYLVDGYGIVYRSYFAFIGRPLLTPDGRNASSVYGFLRWLLNLVKAEEPKYLAVVFDPVGPTFRHELYHQYKANRDKTPADLHAQVPVIEEILSALGVPILRVAGYEADDVMATVAARCSEAGRPCAILSGDKDILQLLDQHVYVLEPAKGTGAYAPLRVEQVPERKGVRAEQIVDLLALTGDQSDNVPGVRGIGPKTATKLLERWGSLEGIYAHIEEVTPEGVRAKLIQDRQNAMLSQTLVRLRRDVPLEQKIEDLALPELGVEAAIPLLLREGMRNLAAELGWGGQQEAVGSPAERQAGPPETNDSGQGEGGAGATTKREERFTGESAKRGRYELVHTPEALDRWVRAAREAGIVAYDSETDSLDELSASPVGFSLAVREREACYIPVRASDAEVLPERLVRERLSAILQNSAVRIVGQNLKYDYKVARRWGIRPANLHFDTMLAAWLIDSSASSYSLDHLAHHYLGYTTVRYEELIPRGEDRTLAEVPIELVTDYAAEDADIALRLYHELEPRIRVAGMQTLLDSVEMPLVSVLAEMELAGIRLEPEALARYSLELEAEVASIDAKIHELCGREFNVNSTKQLQEILFELLGLTPQRKTQTGLSTDNTVLEALAGEHEVPRLVLAHRNCVKLKSTYVDALPALVRQDTKRIHTHFHQAGTATGRLASRDPNLQNIPVREEGGRRIREAFVPEDGWFFMSADYSQIELVILAHLSGDPRLCEAFRKGADVHTQTAALLYGMEEEHIGPDQRRIGKTINFGVIYGMSAFRLARDLRIGRKEAERFISSYFQTYAGVDAFIKDTIGRAERDGYVSTIMGRRRAVPGITSRNKSEKAAAERVAVNSPIQGSAADIVKKAMLDVDRALRLAGLQARLLLQVHDELILEVPRQELKKAEHVVRSAMEGALELSVPLRVNLNVGSSWGAVH